jgi:3-hydroxyisobutyrate dehydrogenase-like beta-hydroxyacid dehydrogenase
MTRRTKKNVGLIGLGIIGSRVRDVLRRKGFHVFVWNRTPRPVPNFVGSPSELAEMCDYLQIFVSDDDALLDVVRQLSPALAPRHVVMAHSTVAPHSILAAAEVVERRGARFVEAPFTGSKEAAENGQLVYYVGGDEVAVREVQPILEASSKEVMIIGAVGQATTIKITTNMVTAASVQAAAEALALVQAAGVPLQKFADAMKGNGSNSKTLDLKLPKMIDGQFDPHFSIKHMLKDMQIASRLGLSHHLELGVTSAARDRLLEQNQRGHGDEDYSAIARKFFHDIRPASQEEEELELFEPRPVPEPPPEMVVDLPIESPVVEPTPAISEELAPESAPEPEMMLAPAEAILTTAPSDETPAVSEPVPEIAPEPVAAELLEEKHSEEEPADVKPESPAVQSRGFFGRLLRRGNDS